MTDARMTDIVDRLRKPSGIGEPMDHMAMEEAAAEIERLRGALRDLLDDCVEYCRINNLHNDDGGPATNHAMRRARAALGSGKGHE